MKIALVILETTGVSFLVGKLAEHISFPLWGAMPAFYRFTTLASLVAMLCIGAHELRREAKK